MEIEETLMINQQTKIFNFPQGNLKKEFTEQPIILGLNDCVNQETNNFKIPQVDLNNPNHVHYEEFDLIELSKIEIFNKVSFKTKGTKKYPILLTDSKRYVCIYGKEYVESALAAEDPSIRCLVKYVQILSDENITIQATAIRIKPEGDPVTYPEILIAFNAIFENYEESGTDLSYVAHGGARRGEAFYNLKVDDFIDVELVPVVGKSRKTILNYKSDAKYIAVDLFDHLIQKKAGKDYFEKIRNKKNEAIRSFEEETNDDSDYNFTEYLKIIMSENIRDIFIEYKQKKPTPNFLLLTRTDMEYIKNEVKLIIDQIEKGMDEENEKKRQESLNIVEDEPSEVKFPCFDNHADNTSINDDTQLLLEELKKIYEEIGKFLTDTSIHNVKSEILKYKAKILKLLTA